MISKTRVRLNRFSYFFSFEIFGKAQAMFKTNKQSFSHSNILYLSNRVRSDFYKVVLSSLGPFIILIFYEALFSFARFSIFVRTCCQKAPSSIEYKKFYFVLIFYPALP